MDFSSLSTARHFPQGIDAAYLAGHCSGPLAFPYAATMTKLDQDWTKILGWPGYRVYQHEINEKKKTLKLWVRRKAGNQKLVCGGCGQRVHEIRDVYEREVRDLPWGSMR